MSLALDIQDDLAELLDDPEYGRKVVVRRVAPGTYDPTTGGTNESEEVPTETTTRGLLLGYKDSLVDGTLVKQGDRKCILKVKGMTFAPEVTHQMDVYDASGRTITDQYTIVAPVKTGELGGTTYLYVAQVRK